LGGWHSGEAPSPEQAALQLAPSVLQVKGAQLKVAPPTQAPTPLQVEASVFTPATHFWAAQMVPAAYWRQPPAPLQAPSLPQLCAP
jgi:hypothetical protein